MAGRTIRIGCSSGFWGDSPSAAFQLVKQGGHLDYLVSDYLAEVTMCILARSKRKTASDVKGGAGEGGFIREYVDTVFKPLMKDIMQRNIKLITNAGGMNPLGLKLAIEQAAKDAGLTKLPVVAAVVGDDLTEVGADLRTKGALQPFVLEGEKEQLWPEDQMLMSCNSYLGAFPIAQALKQGAQIVVTGRCVDSAIVLGPLIHEFGWRSDQYDLLSAGSLAGHILECGCQTTGGNYTDWRLSHAAGWVNVGYPIAECSADGSFVVTKPDNTGGIVTPSTVAEQMVYEIGDPSSYILADVVCDWREVQIETVSGTSNRVRVSGARGTAPTNSYKVAMTTFDGFKLGGMLVIGGQDAAQKAEAVGQAVFGNARRVLAARKLPDFKETYMEVLGAEDMFGGHSRVRNLAREVLLRLVAVHSSDKALGIFGKEFAPIALSTAPGITGSFDSGRPTPAPVIKYYSGLLPKDQVPITVTIGDKPAQPFSAPTELSLVRAPQPGALSPAFAAVVRAQPPPLYLDDIVSVPLITLCYGRSGDKGNSSNIGLIARHPEYYGFLLRHVTAAAVHQHMRHLVKGKVARFELPGIHGLNFLLTQSLGGGGVSSLRTDRQGKCHAQVLLQMNVLVPRRWATQAAEEQSLAPKL